MNFINLVFALKRMFKTNSNYKTDKEDGRKLEKLYSSTYSMQ